jgi:hypothetical protein
LIRAKVGVADFERHPGHYQRLLVSAELFRHGGPNPAPGLEQCMDYDLHEDVGFGLATFTSQGNNPEDFDLCNFHLAIDEKAWEKGEKC